MAYRNGAWIPEGSLAIPVGDLGFMLGVTVTERLRTFNGALYRPAEHLARLGRSLEIIGLPGAPIATELGLALEEYMARHAQQFAPGDDWAVVVFVTPGDGSGQPLCCVHGFPLPFNGWAHQFQAGVDLLVSDYRQTPASCWPPELKCRSRMHYYLADQQAQRRKPGARALLLDQDGFVGEASTANVVAYRKGEGVVSPKIAKVLPGVSVGVLRELAEALGERFVERDMTIDELLHADEVWLCSTSVCVLPVASCEGRPLIHGGPGEAYRRFLAAWSERVGVDIAAQAERFAAR